MEKRKMTNEKGSEKGTEKEIQKACLKRKGSTKRKKNENMIDEKEKEIGARKEK